MESLFVKVTGLKYYNFIKKETPPQLFFCEYHKLFKNSFLYGTPLVAAFEMVEEFLRNYNLIRGICTEEFIRNSSLCLNKLRNGFVQKNL